ncbi:MAG: hypothetical protein US50_C0016G0025 [Candidatus Nomurabacteria bacterium GW2011_GWB1_37_5]|uniref:Uncharacterized protein n=1 Tax=Candidatus Nomurabacteria bacterium GW2011_GWB1_37_5 TaxID=1618742 RepID=A0A0G0HA27_9BACT|nr:MAG: hypothetical protein US50_C0016G0025 [Candidatus Nomurabacteria bacterium GW2011_GWB1_37_5]
MKISAEKINISKESFHPKIDFEMALGFLKRRKDRPDFLKWFLPKELHYILNETYSEKEYSEIIENYINNKYSADKESIDIDFKRAKEEWQKIENDYFSIIEQIFNGYQFPKGKYTGIGTNFNMFPRFIQKKIFFFPLQHRRQGTAPYVIAHEMLHFIFFDYIDNKYSIKEGDKIKEDDPKYVWKVSEAFNTVMESWEPYKKLFKIDGRPYTETKEIFEEMKKQWSEKQDIDWLLDKWL